MLRLYGLAGLLMFAATLYCVLDVILTDATLVRNLPKVSWIFLLIFVPPIGIIAWFAGGRPSGTTAALGSTRSRPQPGRNPSTRGNPVRTTTPVLGPEDDPAFVQFLEERERKRKQAEEAAAAADARDEPDDTDGRDDATA